MNDPVEGSLVISRRWRRLLAETRDGVEGALFPVGALALQLGHIQVVTEPLHHLTSVQVVEQRRLRRAVIWHHLATQKRRHRDTAANTTNRTAVRQRQRHGRPAKTARWYGWDVKPARSYGRDVKPARSYGMSVKLARSYGGSVKKARSNGTYAKRSFR